MDRVLAALPLSRVEILPLLVQRTKNKFANNILSSKKGVMAIDIIEQQGELGVDIAEGVRKRAVTHKEYLVSKMDAGELKRMELDKLTSRFNAFYQIYQIY